MPSRALLVLLLILNLGVALWWATRADPAPQAAAALPEGVERLRLLDEPGQPAPAATMKAPPENAPPENAPAGSAPAANAPATTDAAGPAPTVVAAPTETPPAAPACHALGPFADADAAGRASAALQPMVQRLAIRETSSAPRGWRVFLPALPDRATANAAAQRLAGAGFDDQYLMPAADGGAVEIALGRFGNESAAQRHLAALRAAGFEAAAEPIGDAGDTRYWIDVAAGEDVDVAALRRASGATQADAIDCGTLAAAR